MVEVAGAGAGSDALIAPQRDTTLVMAEIVVVLIGLALIGAFLWQVLFSPVEEERPAAYRSARRAPPSSDPHRKRGPGLIRLSRPR